MEINKDVFLQEMAKQRNKAVEDATRRIEREHGFVSGVDYALQRILDYFHEREEKEKSDAEGVANDWHELSADEMSGTQLKQAVRYYRKILRVMDETDKTQIKIMSRLIAGG